MADSVNSRSSLTFAGQAHASKVTFQAHLRTRRPGDLLTLATDSCTAVRSTSWAPRRVSVSVAPQQDAYAMQHAAYRCFLTEKELIDLDRSHSPRAATAAPLGASDPKAQSPKTEREQRAQALARKGLGEEDVDVAGRDERGLQRSRSDLRLPLAPSRWRRTGTRPRTCRIPCSSRS
jgi:hypothetical protein